ncbi:MAG: hypothetical protein H0W72_06085 [Planctomycetes bacterium]|nr:hypothetical protein [Planctomycetota bacterium]
MALVLAAGLAAADVAAPTPGDEVVRRRAEEAMRAFQQDGDRPVARPPDQETVEAIAEIENLLAEAEAFIKTPAFALKAGDCFVHAAKRLRGFDVEQRKGLGKRYEAATDRLNALGKLLASGAALAVPGVDPRDPGEAVEAKPAPVRVEASP